jgi:cellulose synthase/poly-beta-1,6-N-acetylglucosamine synthase-like glycosyltransferase
MMPWWAMALLIFGLNFAIWGTIGLFRLVAAGITRLRRHRAARRRHPARRQRAGSRPGRAPVQPARLAGRRGAGRPARTRSLTENDVAVLIPAHNEEEVIGESLRAIMQHIPPWNVHVVSDASTDNTVELARANGAKVMATEMNLGKAGALQEAIYRFRLIDRFPVVMLLDADTRVEPGYFKAALPLFDDPEVVAVAGAVRTATDRALSFTGQVLVGHRRRIYAIGQRVLKFGQTWRRTNATHIVPGFASLYRTDVLPEIDMNPPGLVIEDFNMTFEIYQKRLGKVGFTLGAVAVTQDPDNFRDYVRQTRRWALGLWQTVRRHGLRPNFFSAMLALLLGELVVSSVVFLLVPVLLLVLGLPALVGGAAAWPVFGPVYLLVSSHMTLSTVFYGVILPDLAMTVIAAAVDRQPVMLLFAAFFPLLRVIDAALGLAAIPLVFRTKSNGRWKSPARQAALQPLPPLAPLPPSMAATEPMPVIRVPDEPPVLTADRAGQPVMIAGLPYQARPEPNPVAAGTVASPEPVSPQYAGDGPHASG